MDRKVNPSVAETVASDSLMGNGLASRAEEISRVTSAAAEDEGRFVPGTLLGGRYRIIGLLGRGGMGEVYRATDLTLGQSVALKFLPEEASRNQRLLERFHGEVRVARLVSHPNVCRVYDIGEIEGMPFISMEYVDGEDLASLLLRIGRLPGDKAVETARKLCAGLTAAHDRGVIHRDLKPQNIMINKRGEVVIMDFGLAAISDQLSGAEVRNGTPAYMAPEQLKGSGVTARSDIYALGLVLYELFTGKKPYDARNVQQLIDLQDSVNLASMTSVAPDIDPGVEKVIRRCLDPDPAKRPAGALAVAAALPGGDPLAAALAAGETPSPEMVAAAGAIQGMPRVWAMFCLLLTVACLLAQIPIRQRRTAFFQRRAGRSAGRAGASIANHRRELRIHPQARRYRHLAGAPLGAGQLFEFPPAAPALGRVVCGRSAHRRVLPGESAAVGCPALRTGHLPESAAVHRGYGDGDSGRQRTAGGFLRRALRRGLGAGPAGDRVPGRGPGHGGLYGDRSRKPADSSVRPAARLEGAAPEDSANGTAGGDRLLEGTDHAGDGRHTPAEVGNAAAASDLNRVQTIVIWTLTCLGGFFVLLLARRNWKLRRTDMQGAWRVAVARFILAGVAWAGLVHPVIGVAFFEHVAASAGDWLMDAAVLFLVYLALEPAVRARWPHSIVTWNRVLAGRWRDPQVASDVLLGAAVGTGMFTFFKLIFALMPHVQPVSFDVNLLFAMGVRQWIGGHAHNLAGGLRFGLLIFLTIFGLRRMLRNDVLAALAAAVLFTLMQGDVSYSEERLLMMALYIVVYGALAFVLLRSGLVATIATLFFADSGNGVILGMNWNNWYAPAGLASLLLLVGIAVYAFRLSLGGRDLLEGEEPG